MTTVHECCVVSWVTTVPYRLSDPLSLGWYEGYLGIVDSHSLQIKAKVRSRSLLYVIFFCFIKIHNLHKGRMKIYMSKFVTERLFQASCQPYSDFVKSGRSSLLQDIKSSLNYLYLIWLINLYISDSIHTHKYACLHTCLHTHTHTHTHMYATADYGS